MLAADFTASLQYLELSVGQFAKITDADPVLVAKWIVDGVQIPRWVDALTHAWCENSDLLAIAKCDLSETAPLGADQVASSSVLLASWKLARETCWKIS